MKFYSADLHVHTALSPCAEKAMTPPAIVATAEERGLNLLAICDHNAAGNARAAAEAGRGRVAVIPGMELATAEKVHVLGLFPTHEAAVSAAEEVRATLAKLQPERRFADQPVMNARGAVVSAEDSSLAQASAFELAAAVDLIRGYGGLVIAAHVDRQSFSVMSRFGSFPDHVRFDALEVSAAGVEAARDIDFHGIGLPLIASSDSHCLSEIGACRTVFQMRAPTFDELALALRGAGGRSCRIA